MIKFFAFALSFLLTLTTLSTAKPLVVSSFSILGDIVKNVGGDLIDVKIIVGANQDTHVYEPTPDDSKMVVAADLIVINGLGFETWFERLVSAAGPKGPIIVASTGIEFHKMMEPQLSDVPVPDPHVWNDVSNVMIWVKNITKALQGIDPKNTAAYGKNAEAYLKALGDLDQWIRAQFKGISKDSCKVITAHDAFNYFEKAYGIVFLSPQGLSTLDEPSAFEMADLIKQIRQEKISTIFVENISSQHLIKQLASETGAKIGGTLYSDALSTSDEPADTYIKLMQSNVTTLVHSLGCFVLTP